jgi:3-hydroxyacyl-[acyl-carrier-protein] dehydratase
LAQSPLFDISNIDMSRVAVSFEDVGRINPQCGHMRQLDHVIWIAEDGSAGLGVKNVRPDEFWVTGHIPGRPIMPGVLIIEAAAQLSSVLYRRKAGEARFIGFTRCDHVAFRGQVLPGDTLYLLAQEESFRARRFVSQTQAMVNGALVFEGEITGMVM